jgi:hypothetical protein
MDATGRAEHHDQVPVGPAPATARGRVASRRKPRTGGDQEAPDRRLAQRPEYLGLSLPQAHLRHPALREEPDRRLAQSMRRAQLLVCVNEHALGLLPQIVFSTDTNGAPRSVDASTV